MIDQVQTEVEIRPKLPPRLDEFRTALEEEIGSAKSEIFLRGVSLVSGRRIAKVGSSFQYAFQLENSLNLPGDTPGDLHVPNRKPVEVTIVAIDGMSVVLSSPKDLGDYIARAKLVSDLTFLMRRLIERIQDLSTAENPVGDRILSNSKIDGNPQSVTQPSLNKSQLAALASSLGRNITYIWGPPGTGKTRTLGSIGFQLMERGRSVLLVSHMNTAVDQAIVRIADLADQEAIRSGKILRIGEPRDKQLMDRPDVLLATHVARRSEEITGKVSDLEEEVQRVKLAVIALSERLILAEWYASSRDDLPKMRKMLAEVLHHDKTILELGQLSSDLSNQSPYWDQATEDARIAKLAREQNSTLDPELINSKKDLEGLRLMKRRLSASIAGGEVTLGETVSVNWMIRRWRGLPSPESQELHLRSLRNESLSLDKSVEAQVGKVQALEERRAELDRKHSQFVGQYKDDPDEVLRQAVEFRERLSEAQLDHEKLTREARSLRAEATTSFREKARILVSMGLADDDGRSAEALFESIENAFSTAANLIGSVDIERLSADVEAANNRVIEIDEEIESLQRVLDRIEEVLISEAEVIATTLTRAYLNDRIRARRYDTLILDEASMAPIPAVWVAASLADKNAVIAGDPEQLPPIVISSKKFAEKWLGRDVFEVSGVQNKNEVNLILLNTQYRMERSIASIANNLIYEGLLTSAAADSGQDAFDTWYRTGWKHDHPVLLIDTGPLKAWVTSVPRGRGASRLNFLSATLCIDLCQIILKQSRPVWKHGDPYRIFIECPYRPHANLLRVLANEHDLENEVLTGTVHTFQGSEAEVVMLDLVNDEPHWRVALFIQNFDANNRRLLNVALTRARKRLIIVGDFDYIKRLSKKAFIGRSLLPYLLDKFPRVSALDVIPEGILARAADASGKMTVGEVERDATRIVVTQDDFYSLLIPDLNSAQHRVVIYSPFMTNDRVSELQVALRAAVDRGVLVQVVTKTE